MNRRRIAMVPIVASFWAACGIAAVPAAEAAPPRGRLPAGPSAFTPASFTVDPSPATRDRAIANALRAISEHPQQAHTAPGHEFVPRTVVVDNDGAAHVRFDRTYKGLPVYGGDIVVHLYPDGSLRSLDSASTAVGLVATTPTVSARRAQAVSQAQFHGTVTSVSTPQLAVRMVGGSATLVWETLIMGVLTDQTPSRLHVLVDAHTGQVVHIRDDVYIFAPAGRTAATTARTGAGAGARRVGTGNSIYSGSVPIDLTLSGGTYSMSDPSHGNGYTADLNHATSGTGTIFSNTTGTFGDGTTRDPASAGVDAYYGAAQTLNYYKNVQGRNGIFGNGAGVPSRTHYGNAYVNAFWDGTQMTYGDGSGNARPLVELDVAGHEMSHGVSGALIGWGEDGETGGMNEGTSDIFGTMVEFYANNARDTPDYTIGELININGNRTPLRYMYNPSLDGTSPNCYTSSNGLLDPHTSVGPLDHWFFLLAVGSGDHGYGYSPTCNKSVITGLGNNKASKIWFRVLASYAKSNENYAAARTDSLKAAADLYGTHCTEYNTVNAAWAAVSVTGPDPVPGTCPRHFGNLIGIRAVGMLGFRSADG